MSRTRELVPIASHSNEISQLVSPASLQPSSASTINVTVTSTSPDATGYILHINKSHISTHSTINSSKQHRYERNVVDISIQFEIITLCCSLLFLFRVMIPFLNYLK